VRGNDGVTTSKALDQAVDSKNGCVHINLNKIIIFSQISFCPPLNFQILKDAR